MINEQEYIETVKRMRTRTARLEREGDYWTEEEKKELATQFTAGSSITKIAVLLQRTEPAIFQQIEKMDLYGRKKRPQRRKSRPKPAACLCPACMLSPSACVRCESDQTRKGEI